MKSTQLAQKIALVGCFFFTLNLFANTSLLRNQLFQSLQYGLNNELNENDLEKILLRITKKNYEYQLLELKVLSQYYFKYQSRLKLLGFLRENSDFKVKNIYDLYQHYFRSLYKEKTSQIIMEKWENINVTKDDCVQFKRDLKKLIEQESVFYPVGVLMNKIKDVCVLDDSLVKYGVLIQKYKNLKQ